MKAKTTIQCLNVGDKTVDHLGDELHELSSAYDEAKMQKEFCEEPLADNPKNSYSLDG